jgi:prophage antirepressor-like protein
MDIIKTFILDNSNYEVNILIENGKPLFRASDIAKILNLTNIHKSIRDYDNDEKVLTKSSTLGGIQETTFLTKHGIYRLLMRSNKLIARPFQKWIYNILDTIEETGKYELKEEIEKIKEENKNKIENIINEKTNEIIILDKKYKEDIEFKTHEMLIETFDNKNVVYFGKIKDMENDKILIKIGNTQDIRKRANALKNDYGSMVFFRVFECTEYKNFESFLHGHSEIKKYLYNNSVNGMKISAEIFLMNKEEINKSVNIATRSISQFNNVTNIKNKSLKNTIKELKTDLIEENTTIKKTIKNLKTNIKEELQTDISGLKNDIQNILSHLQNNNKNILNKEVKNEILPEVKEDKEVQYENKRGICTITGNKVQRYDREGKVLIHTYNTVMEALRDPTIKKPSRTGIFLAAEKNTIYNEFRWALLDRDLPDDTFQELKESVEVVTIRKGYIAQLNKEKNKILDVFTNQKILAQKKGMKSTGWISTVIKQQKLYNECYYLSWSECSDKLQEEYLENNKLPEEDTIRPHQIKVLKLDPITKEVLHKYNTITEVTTKYKITARTLKSAINGDLIKREFRWKFEE